MLILLDVVMRWLLCLFFATSPPREDHSGDPTTIRIRSLELAQLGFSLAKIRWRRAVPISQPRFILSCPPSRSRERERERKADEVELESTPPFVPKASEATRNAPVRKWNSLKRQDKVSGLKRGRPIQGQGGRGEESAGPTPLPPVRGSSPRNHRGGRASSSPIVASQRFCFADQPSSYLCPPHRAHR